MTNEVNNNFNPAFDNILTLINTEPTIELLFESIKTKNLQYFGNLLRRVNPPTLNYTLIFEIIKYDRANMLFYAFDMYEASLNVNIELALIYGIECDSVECVKLMLKINKNIVYFNLEEEAKKYNAQKCIDYFDRLIINN